MTAGIYGKLPGAADFCRKHLPNSFVEPWDRWLQECLSQAREALGDKWEKAYLSSPLWCFAIDAGVVSEVGWTGVLATSVDASGRYYPLTLACSIDQLLPSQTLAVNLQIPLQELEKNALALIEGDKTIEDVLAVLERVDRGLATLDSLGAEPMLFANSYGSELAALLTNPLFAPVSDLRRSGLTTYTPAPRPSNVSVWWHYGWPDRNPEAIRVRGLPTGAMFASFLDGRWKDHGWRH